MKMRFQEALSILAITLMLFNVCKAIDARLSSDTSDSSEYVYDYDEQMDGNFQNSVVNQCPRDCLCAGTKDARTAKCSRLEIGTQIFDDSITGLEVSNMDRKHPLILTDMIFYKMGLHKLSNMKLINNVLIMLEPTSFNGLQSLSSVNFTNNQITDIDMNVFQSNPGLALVDLSNNPLSISKYDAPILNSSSIQELEIARCGITKLNRKTFSLLSNIMYINLAGNKLMDLDPLIFANLIALEEVDLSDNFIKVLPYNLFVTNPNMTTLALRGNPIESVVGVEISELLTIDLSLTNIKAVGPSMFSGMNILSNVNLSGSGISKIHNQAFHNLTFLNFLDLSDNNLDMISDQLIKENLDLDIFKIARNPLLTNLPSEGFACAKSTFNIYLFDASGCSIEILPDNAFKTMSTLSQLLLADNQITTIGKSLYYSPKLIKIDLSNNLLTTLDKNTFSRNTELGKLNLAGNPLKTISPELFIDNPNLAWLDVSYCDLTSLWDVGNIQPRTVMNNLHFINASYNEISSIKKKELEIINKLFTLDISENPLECNLDFEVLMTWLGEHHVSPGTKDMIVTDTEITEDITNKAKKWEELAKTVCKLDEPLINNKVAVQNKISTENKDVIPKKDNVVYVDDLDNEDDDDYEYDEDEDETEDHVYDESYIKNKKNKNKLKEIMSNAENGFKVTMIDNEKQKLTDEDSEVLVELVSKINDDINVNQANIPLVDEYIKDTERTEEELVNAYLEEDRRYHDIIVPLKVIGFVLVIVFLILGLIKLAKQCSIKNQNHVRCAIISLNPSRGEGRVKKDCGLVYQQLSEDLSGPKTPIISRHLLGVNTKNKLTSYQVGPFHHNNITPENV